ncbi:pilus assembly protein TadG-related protein [Geomonas azotofigens]|uniref:pilus assembly protein TadG-related protein n=1 Tax=Geomonas azotofigens TaxID=2843196 RepID=UPI001C0FD439|nr:pilus assembly protein TadG-related protein [Geomonas azotofigens]MBU5614559.1 Tad domain-containing protein [Geomonas azotofigens]
MIVSEEESAFDTSYVTIMLVVFLVVTGLAIDIGYMYVSEEDLQHSAEMAALTGAQGIKQRYLLQAQTDPARLPDVARDPVQSQARAAAVDLVTGKHDAAALVGLLNNNGNALTGENDITVGFWNMSSRSYTPGATPVNAIQVRTRRTAESSSVGLGTLGTFIAKISGTEDFGSTPVATAALVPGTRSNIAICSEACQPACTFPQICTIPERRMSHAAWDPKTDGSLAGRYLYTSLLHPVTITNSMSDLVCQEMPVQEVCGLPIFAAASNSDSVLRDIKAMMYDPQADRSNKEYDKSGKLVGWWVIVPATDCSGFLPGVNYQQHTVTRYSLVRISRICTSGAAGCGKAGSQADLPATACTAGSDGLYIDRISCVGCDSQARKLLPGLRPVLVD